MSRTARTLIAGLAAAGVLVVGAGSAYAEDSDNSGSSSSRSSRSSSSSDESAGSGRSSRSSEGNSTDSDWSESDQLPTTRSADSDTGLLGSLPLSLLGL